MIGPRIRALRKGKKMTQGELAYRMGIAPESLCRIENEQRTPSLRLTLRACLALGVTPDDLLVAALQDMAKSFKEGDKC